MGTKNQKQEVNSEELAELPMEVSQNEIEPEDFFSDLCASKMLFVMVCVCVCACACVCKDTGGTDIWIAT